MLGIVRKWAGDWRGRGLALCLAALLMQIAVPGGFMVDNGPKGAGLVVCTGHGPLVIHPASKHTGKDQNARADAPCGFAGHGATPTPPAALALNAAPAAITPALAQPLRPALAILALAAPPPPSQGPPRSI